MSSPTSKVENPTIIGCVREIKRHENRVGMTPAAAREYVKKGHYVIIESGAGKGSCFTDAMYEEMGCEIRKTAEEVFSEASMIVKVKEPLPEEYDLLRRGQVIFTYFHFAANEELTNAVIKSGAVCIAYETITKDGMLPLLLPMSEIAGKMAVQEGAKYLERAMGGLGILLGGVPGVRPARVLVMGGGVVGACASKVAAGMGADVVVLDVNLNRLRHLDDIMPKNVRCLYSTEQTLLDEIKQAHLIIGAVLIPGAKCPKLIRREHLKSMMPGTVIVDVAVDQGGCVQTCHATTHDDPVYEVDGVIHYCVSNMPGGVPQTSTTALSNATMQYGLSIATDGWVGACKLHPELKSGLNVVYGKVVCKGVADAFDLPLVDVEEVLVG
eukprot:Lankesteria_metandrocarpae@DN5056_c0_g1_i1.p1